MNRIGSFEVKAFLKEDLVIGEDGNIKKEVLDLFETSSELDMAIAYLDTEELALNGESWNIRVRKKNTSGKHEFDFKKRYANADIESAINDGFMGSDFESELDMGYAKNTLSFGFEKKESFKFDDDLLLPSESKAIETVLKVAPEKFVNYKSKDWGKDNAKVSRYYGPVYAKRFKGNLFNEEITLEIWNILSEDKANMEQVVEASFKTSTHEKALELKTRLEAFLDEKGLLSKIDKMKTQIILERY